MAARRTHDVSPRDTLDRTFFLFAFALGVGGGILLKIMGAHAFISAGYAGLILVLYAVAAWLGGRVKIEPEVIGDNCYYLGFLFTLASLSYTLYQMADPSLNGGRAVDIPAVISGFGVALSSTIVGVFLRVFMMQMRPDFVAKDREVRSDINRSFLDFRKNMSGMLSQMKGYAAESVQMASERDERIRASTEKFTQDHQESLTASADFLATHMRKSFSEAAQQAVKDISQAVIESNKAQQEQMTQTLKELETLKLRLNEQEIQSFEDMSRRRKVLLAELEKSEKQMQDHNKIMEQYIRITQKSSDAMTKKIVPALVEFEKKLSEFQPVNDAPFHTPEEATKHADEVVDRPYPPKEKPPGPWILKGRGPK